MFKIFHNKMLRGQQTRAQNVDPCSKIAHTREDLCAKNVTVKGFKKKKSVPVKLYRPQNQVTGYSNQGRRLGKIERSMWAGSLGPASLARETISPVKALMEMPGQSSHLETVS